MTESNSKAKTRDNERQDTVAVMETFVSDTSRQTLVKMSSYEAPVAGCNCSTGCSLLSSISTATSNWVKSSGTD